MKRTSKKWNKGCRVKILDPDGWDRSNYDYSWNVEKITRKEFENRLCFSTVRDLRFIAKGTIWKNPICRAISKIERVYWKLFKSDDR